MRAGPNKTYTKHVEKIAAVISVYTGMLVYQQPVRGLVLRQVLLLLGHPFPKLRKLCAEQFYMQLLSYDELLPEDDETQDRITEILTTTVWDCENTEMQAILAARDEVCSLFSSKVPEYALKPGFFNDRQDAAIDYTDVYEEAFKSGGGKALDNYGALVNEMGF